MIESFIPCLTNEPKKRTKSSTGEKLIETQNQKQELEKRVAAYEEEISQKNTELENVKKASVDEVNTINDLKTYVKYYSIKA